MRTTFLLNRLSKGVRSAPALSEWARSAPALSEWARSAPALSEGAGCGRPLRRSRVWPPSQKGPGVAALSEGAGCGHPLRRSRVWPPSRKGRGVASLSTHKRRFWPKASAWHTLTKGSWESAEGVVWGKTRAVLMYARSGHLTAVTWAVMRTCYNLTHHDPHCWVSVSVTLELTITHSDG